VKDLKQENQDYDALHSSTTIPNETSGPEPSYGGVPRWVEFWTMRPARVLVVVGMLRLTYNNCKPASGIVSHAA
jgi:hypothetical protein